jgi:hypothetical protein
LEVWLEDNEQALPRRFVVTYRSLPGRPIFIAELSDWDFSIQPPDRDFVFQPPAGVTEVELKASAITLSYISGAVANKRDAITATGVLKKLEQILGMRKSEWNAGLVRSLWAALENCMAQRRTSADYEETWLILAGFPSAPWLWGCR